MITNGFKYELIEEQITNEENEVYKSYGLKVITENNDVDIFSDLFTDKEKLLTLIEFLSCKNYSSELMQMFVETAVTYNSF